MCNDCFWKNSCSIRLQGKEKDCKQKITKEELKQKGIYPKEK